MVVLIVEDEAIIACCSAAMLEEAGHQVLGPAHTSSEAFELVRNRRPDVALIDIDLETPGAGVEVARQLRARFGTAVIFTTGRMDVARAHPDLAVVSLSKPYDPSAIPAIVEGAATQWRSSARITPLRTASFTAFGAHSGSGA
jgi:two-component system, response regulator PdtaR